MTNEPLQRLGKRDVETLVDDYDANPVAALTRALQVVLRRPDAAWVELLGAAGLPDARRRELAAANILALDELMTELNERRTLGQ